ncbi:MAG: PspC domain-containing protein, partial [Thermoleophilaceae bacterium]|nr:PspC domain-containing protein [Thermoleophilaceae bacterium]
MRSTQDRVLAGVCGGIARRYGIDVAIVRVAAVVLALAIGFGVIAYLAAALLMPSDDAAPDVKPDRTAALIVLGLLLFFAWPFVLGGGLLIAGLAVPVAVLALLGLLAWWLATGQGPQGETGDVVRWSALGAGLLLLCGVLFTGGAAAAAFGGGTVAAAVVIGAGAV